MNGDETSSLQLQNVGNTAHVLTFKTSEGIIEEVQGTT
jgi:hypothetical protein